MPGKVGMSRRLSLAGLLVIGVAASLATGASPAAQAVVKPAPPRAHTVSTLTPIQHVIVIMQENRSFDEYFGTYPGANGISGATCNPDPVTGNCILPYHDTSDFQAGAQHTSVAANVDIDSGLMNGYVTEAVKAPGYTTCPPPVPPSGTCTDVMGYHNEQEIPNLWTYAQNYVLQDAMFEPIKDWSLNAHLYEVSAWAAQCKNPTDPTTCAAGTGAADKMDDKCAGCNKSIDCDDFDPVPVGCGAPQGDYGWTDITYLLHRAGVSWKEYYGKNAPEWWKPISDFVDVHQDQQATSQFIEETGSEASGSTAASGFYADAGGSGGQCNLPNVSWVIPGAGKSDHPPSVSSKSEEYVTSLINAVESGPCWGSTAIYLSWDDWGGFYDHVNPPSANGVAYGIRVPGLLISPYARRGKIDHQTLSHDAYLKFIEDNFLGGQRLDPATDGRWDPRPVVRENSSLLGDLASEFNFTQRPLRPLVLPEATDTSNRGPAGSKTQVSGKYFQPNETVTIRMACSWAGCLSTTVLGTATTDSSGSFGSVTVTIPSGFAGQNVIGVVGNGTATDFAQTNYTATS
jgi:phospholipase C